MARTKPAIRVHLSVSDHDKTGEVWSDLVMRGMLVELWRKAGEKFAGKRDDKVPLKPTDRMDISCTHELKSADEMLLKLCKAMRYPVRKYSNRWVVTVRNFSKKQGYGGKEPDIDPESNNPWNTSPPSPSPNTSPKNDSESNSEIGFTSESPEQSPADQARGIWPVLVEIASKYGATWSSKPGVKQVEIVAARISDGASLADITAAVDGYIRKCGTEAREGFDPMAHFTATTIFRVGKFDANVQASKLPEPKSPTDPESPAAARERRTNEAAKEAFDAIKRRRDSARVSPGSVIS